MSDKVWNLRMLLQEMLEEHERGYIRPVTLKLARQALRETDPDDWLRPVVQRATGSGWRG